MSYVVRSNSENLFIDTPIIGLPNDIIFLTIESGVSKYNGPYISQPSGSELFQKIYNDYGYVGRPIWSFKFWVNPINNCYIESRVGPDGAPSSSRTIIFYDPAYYSLREEGFNRILWKPYFTYSGDYDTIETFYWEKNYLVFPASTPPEYIGYTELPGQTPQTKYYQLSFPDRTVTNIAGQKFLTLSKV